MPDTKDLWYVRLPDGRVRGGTAAVIRQQLASGRLPPGTPIRRSGETEWYPIANVGEFAGAPTQRNGTAADAGPPATIASRLDPGQMRLAGVRPLLEELLGALDSTFVRRKLIVAVFAGLLLGGIASLTALPAFGFAVRPPGLGWLLPVAAVAVWSWLAVVLSKMTFAELSRLRPAKWSDAREGGFGATVHLFLANGIILVLLGAVIFGLRSLPDWLLTRGTEDTARAYAIAQVATVAGMVLELFVWPVFVLLLPLAALIVVEEVAFPSALGRWLSMLWRKGRRILLAEMLALGIGLLLAVPLALLAVALASRFGGAATPLAAAITQSVLLGLLSSLLLAYLTVANVFIYLSETAGR